MVSAEEVRERLVERLPCTHAEVEDVSGGCGTSFELRVLVSPAFADCKGLLAKHRVVNAALADELKADIHSLSIKKCLTPDEYAAQGG